MIGAEERARLSAVVGKPNWRVASLDALDAAEPPTITANRRIEAINEPPASTALVNVMEAEPTDQLTRLVGKSLGVLEECLDYTGAGDTDSIRALNIRKEAAQTILNTQAKVDDTQLKRRQVDMLPRLLEIIAREVERNPKVVEHEAHISQMSMLEQ